MKKYPLYKLPIGYMVLYTLLILGTGVWLFLLSQGLSESGSFAETLQKVISSPAAKSLHNLAEISVPHLFALGTLIFVAAHFMLFSTKVPQKVSLIVAISLFSIELFNISVYLFISLGWVVSGWIKLVSMGGFVSLFLLLLWMVFVSL